MTDMLVSYVIQAYVDMLHCVDAVGPGRFVNHARSTFSKLPWSLVCLYFYLYCALLEEVSDESCTLVRNIWM